MKSKIKEGSEVYSMVVNEVKKGIVTKIIDETKCEVDFDGIKKIKLIEFLGSSESDFSGLKKFKFTFIDAEQLNTEANFKTYIGTQIELVAIYVNPRIIKKEAAPEWDKDLQEYV